MCEQEQISEGFCYINKTRLDLTYNVPVYRTTHRLGIGIGTCIIETFYMISMFFYKKIKLKQV